MIEELKIIARELCSYNPLADEYKGLHIHKVWANRIDAALSQQPAQSIILRKPTIITLEQREMMKGEPYFANDGAERDWSELEAQQPAQPMQAVAA